MERDIQLKKVGSHSRYTSLITSSSALHISEHSTVDLISENISSDHLMLVEKVTDDIHPYSIASDFDEDMSESKAEEDDMNEIEEPDDLMTLNQFQHGLHKEMLAWKGP